MYEWKFLYMFIYYTGQWVCLCPVLNWEAAVGWPCSQWMASCMLRKGTALLKAVLFNAVELNSIAFNWCMEGSWMCGIRYFFYVDEGQKCKPHVLQGNEDNKLLLWSTPSNICRVVAETCPPTSYVLVCSESVQKYISVFNSLTVSDSDIWLCGT